MTGTASLVADAEALAGQLLASLRRRWLHVQAVAGCAADLQEVVDERDTSILVASAWLHDVGYAPELVRTGFHPLDGARYLREQGWPKRIVNLVAHHSGARFEAEQRGLTAELAEFELEDSLVMDALIAADLTTGPNGELLGYRDRVSEILRRYPASDPVHQAWLWAADSLEANVQRALSQVASWPPSQ